MSEGGRRSGTGGWEVLSVGSPASALATFLAGHTL